MHRTARLAAIPAFAALRLRARASAAGPVVGADLDMAVGVGPGIETSSTGFDGRLGQELSLGNLKLRPEIAAGYYSAPAELVRVRGGLVLSLGGFLMPSALAHAGYADAGLTDEDGLALDAGLAFDVRPVDVVSAGVHASVNTLGTNGRGDSWVGLGARVAHYF